MEKREKIYVAGHLGLVGSALVRALEGRGYHKLLLRTHAELDLERQAAVEEFFQREKPDFVFLAAAKVGGILANKTYPADFIYNNLLIQVNVINAAYKAGTKRLLFLGSSCIYPKFAPQPMREEYLLTGELEPTNEPYAVAKIAGIKLCESYNRQYGTKFMAVMPTNLYGPNDNFNLGTSHVLPAMIRKFHEAKEAGDPRVVLWGTGAPRREFLHVDDMADACLYVMNLEDEILSRELLAPTAPVFLNVGTGVDVTIKELAEIVSDVVGFGGGIVWDRDKPDGTPRKLLDVGKLHALGWRAKTNLRSGVESSYQWYLENVKEARR